MDFLICQTSAASPAEPGELLFWFRGRTSIGEGSDRPLTVITGDRKTRERRAGRRRALDQNEQITCWRCENEIGIATSMAVRVILAPRRTPLGRLVPGTEGWICAYCLKRGKVTSLSKY
jgi:hypothetical protein